MPFACWILSAGTFLFVETVDSAASDDAQLVRAEGMLAQGQFDSAIILLHEILMDASLPADRTAKGYRLLAIAYLAKDSTDKARDAVRHMLSANPAYEPDPSQDTPALVQIIEEMKVELSPPERQATVAMAHRAPRRWSIRIGGGGVMGTVVPYPTSEEKSSNLGEGYSLEGGIDWRLAGAWVIALRMSRQVWSTSVELENVVIYGDTVLVEQRDMEAISIGTWICYNFSEQRTWHPYGELGAEIVAVENTLYYNVDGYYVDSMDGLSISAGVGFSRRIGRTHDVRLGLQFRSIFTTPPEAADGTRGSSTPVFASSLGLSLGL